MTPGESRDPWHAKCREALATANQRIAEAEQMAQGELRGKMKVLAENHELRAEVDWALTTVIGFNEGLSQQTSPSAVLLTLEDRLRAALQKQRGNG